MIGHFKEQTACFKRRANRNGLPHAGAKGKSTIDQTNTKARKGGGQYKGGALTAEPSCSVFGMRVCQRGEGREEDEVEEEEEEEGESESYSLAPSVHLSISVIHKHMHIEPAGVLCDSVTMVTTQQHEVCWEAWRCTSSSREQRAEQRGACAGHLFTLTGYAAAALTLTSTPAKSKTKPGQRMPASVN